MCDSFLSSNALITIPDKCVLLTNIPGLLLFVSLVACRNKFHPFVSLKIVGVSLKIVGAESCLKIVGADFVSCRHMPFSSLSSSLLYVPSPHYLFWLLLSSLKDFFFRLRDRRSREIVLVDRDILHILFFFEISKKKSKNFD